MQVWRNRKHSEIVRRGQVLLWTRQVDGFIPKKTCFPITEVLTPELASPERDLCPHLQSTGPDLNGKADNWGMKRNHCVGVKVWEVTGDRKRCGTRSQRSKGRSLNLDRAWKQQESSMERQERKARVAHRQIMVECSMKAISQHPFILYHTCMSLWTHCLWEFNIVRGRVNTLVLGDSRSCLHRM